MVNPLLTILFDLFIIGSAFAVSAAMAVEYFASREPQVGSKRVSRPQPQTMRRSNLSRMPSQRGKAA
jgi:hypothetical protein